MFWVLHEIRVVSHAVAEYDIWDSRALALQSSATMRLSSPERLSASLLMSWKLRAPEWRQYAAVTAVVCMVRLEEQLHCSSEFLSDTDI